MTDPSSHAESIFWKALEITSPDDRAGFLEEACGGDQGLRVQISEMLAAYPAAQQFLEQPAAGFGPTLQQSAVLETAGTVIGPYRLLEQIGEGGFGVVFMAEQTAPVKRKVALKVIKPGMDSREVIARFEAERQALALMDHPNIAKVLDAGATETGRPFFVMELVRGVPITEYCDQAQLTPQRRLELFVTVCQAVQHAHQKGIIHRDIKPTNVLVALHDDRPVVKVIDFGVAKATSGQLTDKTFFTGFAQLIGTPLYMSPEQAALNANDIDTRSDIYSLGVLLYELLTGTTPFDKTRLQQAAFEEIRRIIREEEPQKPSTRLSSLGATLPSVSAVRRTEPRKLSQLVRGDLDWIVMKALEKDRARRYETANGFASDILRYLADEPVEACPPSTGYRFRKFAQRNRTALNMSAVVVVLLLLAVGSIGWAVRDRSLREERAAGERADRQARLTSRVSALLEEVGRFEREQNWPEALATAQRAQAISAEDEVDPGVQEEVVRQLRDLEFVARLEEVRLERSFSRAGDFDNSRGAVAYAKAFREFGIDLEQLPSDAAISRLKEHPQIAFPLAVAIDDFAEVRSELSGSTDPGFLSLVSIARGLDQDSTRDRLRELWTHTDSPEIRGELQALIDSLDVVNQSPTTLALIGRALSRAGLGDESVSLLREAQSLHPGDFWINFDLAERLQVSGDYESAISYYSVAIAIRPTAGSPYNNLGVVHFRKKQYAEAEACFRRVIQLDSTSSIAQYNLGKTLYYAERWAESVEAYQRAIELDPLNAGLHHLLGLSQKELGRIDDAEESLTKSIEYYQRDAESAPRNATILYNLSTAQYELKHFDDAIESLSQAVELDPENGYATNLLSAWLAVTPELLKGEPARAVQLACRATRRQPDDYFVWKTLGMAHYRAGSWTDAITALEESCRLESSTNGKGNAWQWLFMAMAHWQLGNQEQARQLYEQSLEVEHVWPEELLSYRVEAEELLGEWASPEKFRERELTALNQLVEQHLGSPCALGARAEWLLFHGRFSDADADYVELLQLHPTDHWIWYYRACLLAYLGRDQEFREHCHAMMDRFGSNTDDIIQDRTIKSALLLPDGVGGDVEELAARADRVVLHLPWADWAALLKGLAECRTGRYAQAVQWLEKSSSAPANGFPARVVAANAYAAIALRRLGRETEAQAALERANRQATEELPRFDSGKLNTGGGIENWLIAQTALREANAVVTGLPHSEPLQASGPPVPSPPPRPFAATPFGMQPAAIPGVLQVEDFDEGGEGLAYHDTTYKDTGRQSATPRYRVESVDLDDCNDRDGGFCIGEIIAHEWLSYTVVVAEAGDYELDFRLCSLGGGRLHVEFAGIDRTGSVVLPETGRDNWTTVTASRVRLDAGRQLMRVVFDSTGTDSRVCDLNWIEIRRAAQSPPATDSGISRPTGHSRDDPPD